MGVHCLLQLAWATQHQAVLVAQVGGKHAPPVGCPRQTLAGAQVRAQSAPVGFLRWSLAQCAPAIAAMEARKGCLCNRSSPLLVRMPVGWRQMEYGACRAWWGRHQGYARPSVPLQAGQAQAACHRHALNQVLEQPNPATRPLRHAADQLRAQPPAATPLVYVVSPEGPSPMRTALGAVRSAGCHGAGDDHSAFSRCHLGPRLCSASVRPRRAASSASSSVRRAYNSGTTMLGGLARACRVNAQYAASIPALILVNSV